MINNSFNFLVLFNSMRKIITICFAALKMLSISFRMNFFFIFKKIMNMLIFIPKRNLRRRFQLLSGHFISNYFNDLISKIQIK